MVHPINSCIHKKIVEHSTKTYEGDLIIEWNKLMNDILGSLFHFPKPTRYIIIKELQQEGLILKLNKFKVKVLRID